MKTRKKRKGIGALVLAAVLSAAMFTGVQAAGPAFDVDNPQKCSVTFSVSTENFPDFAKPMDEGGAKLEVKLYKVADMTASGAFGAPVGVFEGMELPDGNTADGPAVAWEKLAAEAHTKIGKPGGENPVTTTIDSTKVKEEKKAASTVSNLTPGLYLVAADKVESAGDTYEFTPYLISLPNNKYLADVSGGEDSWDYEVESELKLKRTDLYGDLEISKTLNTYNTSLGPVSFLFQVEATKKYVDVKDQKPKKVYSNVVAISFDNAGTKTTTIEHIPAGAEVTVKELSPAGSYEPAADSKNPQKAVISKNTVAKVSFENNYNNGVIVVHTIDNQFKQEKDRNGKGTGNWTWTKVTDGKADEGVAVQGKAPSDAGIPGDGSGTPGSTEQGGETSNNSEGEGGNG